MKTLTSSASCLSVFFLLMTLSGCGGQLLNRSSVSQGQKKDLSQMVVSPNDYGSPGERQAKTQEGSKQQQVSSGKKEDVGETVDLFPQKAGKSGEQIFSSHPESLGLKNSDQQVDLLNQAIEYFYKNQYDKAMVVFKEYENSPLKQVRTRSVFYIGEILFQQKEYDLALQVFEKFLTQHASSGLTTKALVRVVTCAEKIGLQEKKNLYYPLLNEFFSAGST